ncbi:MAG TPA: bifunctional DNA-formamidopyrimidine glycosylase/DNA-(apurinic or apyrimidinic site) lyase [Candidatus Binatia bacterium]
MPELPEVETTCRTLLPLIRGRVISRVRVLERRLRIPIAQDFEANLEKETIVGVARRGKYILMDLGSPMVWVIHLGMTGKLIYLDTHLPWNRHDHVVVEFATGDELRLHDPRRFGLSVVLPAADLWRWPPLGSLGLDPLAHGWNGAYLHSVLRSTTRRLRDLLLDQKVVAGVGNIYANEALFRVGLRPTRRAHTVNAGTAEGLAEALVMVLHEAIRWRGTSFSDYRDGRDRKGRFQSRLNVYNREGKPCRVCRASIKRARMGNRGAFYCPHCQA